MTIIIVLAIIDLLIMQQYTRWCNLRCIPPSPVKYNKEHTMVYMKLNIHPYPWPIMSELTAIFRAYHETLLLGLKPFSCYISKAMSWASNKKTVVTESEFVDDAELYAATKQAVERPLWLQYQDGDLLVLFWRRLSIGCSAREWRLQAYTIRGCIWGNSCCGHNFT